jgi:Domain of unknown function (DUF1707)
MAPRTTNTDLSLVRVGDAERDTCMTALAEHHVDGRLSVEELDRRQRAALCAITAADLAGLLTDLPNTIGRLHPSSDAPPVMAARVRRAARWAGPATAMVTTSAVMAVSLQNEVQQWGSQFTFWGYLGSSALGFAMHWTLSRTKRPHE